MASQETDRGEPRVITRAGELMLAGNRRGFLRAVFAGGTVLMMPSVFTGCADDDGGGGNPVGFIPEPVTGLALDLRTDMGIFRLIHIQEQLESAFYAAVVGSSRFGSLFNVYERELLMDLHTTEAIHREFIGAALGTQAVPDIRGSIDAEVLASIVTSHEQVFATARMLEQTGLAALNGMGKYIQDSRNLLVVGKLASVEARHSAALRDMATPPGQNRNTAFAGDDIIDENGRDVKLEAQPAIDRQIATGLVRTGTYGSPAVANPPASAQGAPTSNFFPANP